MEKVGSIFSQAFDFLYSVIVSFFPDSLLALPEVNFLINVVMVIAILYIVYFMCCLDALVLRQKHPEWKRPYKVPCGKLMFVLGMAVSVWVIIGSCLELAIGGYVSLIIYCVLGIVMYMIMSGYRKKNPKEHELITLTPEDINKGY